MVWDRIKALDPHHLWYGMVWDFIGISLGWDILGMSHPIPFHDDYNDE